LLSDRWLFVVGMHRSGTSAVAGVLSGLGFQMPKDNVFGKPDNPIHNESNTLMKLNDRLLGILGGAWHAPPDVSSVALEVDLLRKSKRRAKLAAKYTFPSRAPAIFKDPRLAPLLPFWRDALGGESAAILPWRAPIDVAASLRRRNGIDLEYGLALWEYYNRLALKAVAGMPTLVVRYEDALENPKEFQSQAEQFCSSLKWGIREQFSGEISGFDSSMRNHRGQTLGSLSGSQAELCEVLIALSGPHRQLITPDLPVLESRSQLILDEKRRALKELSSYKPHTAGMSMVRHAKRAVEPLYWWVSARINRG
jgi:hypothetical protein